MGAVSWSAIPNISYLAMKEGDKCPRAFFFLPVVSGGGGG